MLNEMLLPTPTHSPTHPTATNPIHSIPFHSVASPFITSGGRMPCAEEDAVEKCHVFLLR